ncbi:MAG: hypothetical protein EOP49_14230 [Sphingobacteriales bacterium]|nr:MAG: hypothetical protein EOP49_14230 [Sphingobacteriales bacterium]
MSTLITCPSCSSQFEPTDAIAQSIEKEMRNKMEVEWRKRMDTIKAEKQQLENEIKSKQQTMQVEMRESEIEAAIQQNALAELQRKLNSAGMHLLSPGAGPGMRQPFSMKMPCYC